MLIKKVGWFSKLKLLFCVCFSFFPAAAFCIEIIPFHTSNQNPVVQIHGVPPPESAGVLDRGRASSLIVLDVANSFGVDDNSREQINLNGEQWKTTLSFRYGLGNGFELGIDLPLVAQWGGILDGPIQGFHDTFYISQGGRDQAARNSLLYSYSRNGSELFHLDGETVGLGDIRIAGGYRLYQSEFDARRALALRGSIKFPTGSSHNFHGSGSPNFALWLSGREGIPFTEKWGIMWALGGMIVGKGDVLKEMQRELAGFGTFGIAWTPSDWGAVKVQLNSNTSFYRHSSLHELNATSLELVAGGSIGISDSTTIDISFSEDLVVIASSPDFALTIAARVLF